MKVIHNFTQEKTLTEIMYPDDASMKYDILLMTRKALLRLQYEEQLSHTQHP
jgi:hypothetical protein